jgi:hypothetical protein
MLVYFLVPCNGFWSCDEELATALALRYQIDGSGGTLLVTAS